MLFDTPRRDDYLVFGRPQVGEEEIAEVVATLRSGWLGTGPKVAAFEREFSSYVASPHSLAVSSCTAALQLALQLVGLEPGDEVIVPSLTFVATANAVIHAGAVPVLADVDPVSWNLTATEVQRRATERTRVVLPVHFAGRACDMDGLMAVAQKENLAIIEDCAHAIETLWKGRHVGTFGSFGAFSFYVTKNVMTAEGGMLITAAGALAERAKRLALHGLTVNAWDRFSDQGFRHYEAVEAGFKMNMTDIQASLGLHQLARVEANLVRRNQIWARYDEAFADLPLTLPAPEELGTRHGRHLYTVLLNDAGLTAGRDDVMAALHRQRIGTGVHYRAVHRHPYYRDRFGLDPHDFPVADHFSDRTFSLPLGAVMNDQDVQDVIDALRRTLEYFRRLP